MKANSRPCGQHGIGQHADEAKGVGTRCAFTVAFNANYETILYALKHDGNRRREKKKRGACISDPKGLFTACV